MKRLALATVIALSFSANSYADPTIVPTLASKYGVDSNAFLAFIDAMNTATLQNKMVSFETYNPFSTKTPEGFYKSWKADKNCTVDLTPSAEKITCDINMPDSKMAYGKQPAGIDVVWLPDFQASMGAYSNDLGDVFNAIATEMNVNPEGVNIGSFGELKFTTSAKTGKISFKFYGKKHSEISYPLLP